MINEDQYWSISIPHESSGPCYTYDPPVDSESGFDAGMYIIMNSKQEDGWDPDLEMFFHEKGKFFYQDDKTADTVKVQKPNRKSLILGHPRISRRFITSITCYISF